MILRISCPAVRKSPYFALSRILKRSIWPNHASRYCIACPTGAGPLHFALTSNLGRPTARPSACTPAHTSCQGPQAQHQPRQRHFETSLIIREIIALGLCASIASLLLTSACCRFMAGPRPPSRLAILLNSFKKIHKSEGNTHRRCQASQFSF